MKLSVNQIKNTEKDLISFGVTKLHVIFAHDMRKHLFIIIMALGSHADAGTGGGQARLGIPCLVGIASAVHPSSSLDGVGKHGACMGRGSHRLSPRKHRRTRRVPNTHRCRCPTARGSPWAAISGTSTGGTTVTATRASTPCSAIVSTSTGRLTSMGRSRSSSPKCPCRCSI